MSTTDRLDNNSNETESTPNDPNDSNPDDSFDLTVGGEYTLDDFTNTKLDDTEELERTLEKQIATTINGHYVTFTISSVNCIDITDTDNISLING